MDWYNHRWVDIKLYVFIWRYMYWYKSIWICTDIYGLPYKYMSWYKKIWIVVKKYGLLYKYMACYTTIWIAIQICGWVAFPVFPVFIGFPTAGQRRHCATALHWLGDAIRLGQPVEWRRISSCLVHVPLISKVFRSIPGAIVQHYIYELVYKI